MGADITKMRDSWLMEALLHWAKKQEKANAYEKLSGNAVTCK